jgi:excisionase family DNA binding protein
VVAPESATDGGRLSTPRNQDRSRGGDGASRAQPGGDSGVHPAEPLLTPDAVARVLACSPKSIYAWAARGALPSVRLGRLVRFRPSDVRRFIETNVAR